MTVQEDNGNQGPPSREACMRRAQLLVVSLLVAVVASRALAQPAPTFSQTYNYPDGVTPSFNVITATRAFESAAFDTATTFWMALSP